MTDLVHLKPLLVIVDPVKAGLRVIFIPGLIEQRK